MYFEANRHISYIHEHLGWKYTPYLPIINNIKGILKEKPILSFAKLCSWFAGDEFWCWFGWKSTNYKKIVMVFNFFFRTKNDTVYFLCGIFFSMQMIANTFLDRFQNCYHLFAHFSREAASNSCRLGFIFSVHPKHFKIF